MLTKNVELRAQLKKIGVVNPTPIQEQALPKVRAGMDLVGISRTGSGKTLTFLLPLLEKSKKALIIAPTRELARQIARVANKLGGEAGAIYGGGSIEGQKRKLSLPIVVGTPGRLLDFIKMEKLVLQGLDTVIIDEADQLSDKGFLDETKDILNYVKKHTQLLMFSATESRETESIVRHLRRRPEVIRVEEQVSTKLLRQEYYEIPNQDKVELLAYLLQTEDVYRGLIFCATRDEATFVWRTLKRAKIKVALLHGKQKQAKRQTMIAQFQKGKPALLVATPVASRGLHIDDVTHVFNYSLTYDLNEYTHRIGRTARAGASGKAITIAGPDDLRTIRRLLKIHNIRKKPLPKNL